MTSLEQAIRNNDLTEVEQFLLQSPNSIDELSSEQLPLSCLAAMLGHEEIFRYIVEYSRASFHEADEHHQTVLHHAVKSGNLSLVQYITEKLGMSPTEGDIDSITPLDLAVTLNHHEIQQYFETILGCAYEDMFRNPIMTGMHPDPSIVRVGNDYYMVNSSFIYFPCIPISHSKDLIHWTVIGHAITNPSWAKLDELEGGRGFWAPDISYHNGKFYITATYRFNDTSTTYRKQIVVSSKKPEGPYSKPAWIDEDGIDPSLFTDDDGKRYMLLNRGARIFELNEDATKQVSKATLLYYGDNKRAPEGPHLIKKDGYYYLFLAEGGTGLGHRITVSRSKELYGTYEPCPYNPIMRQWDDSAPIRRCGHGKPVQTQNGEWYMVYLCARMIDGKYSILGRETALDPITWTLDGWPLVNDLNGPSTLQKKPNLPAAIETSKQDWKSSKEWVSPRPPEKDGIIISSDGIVIKGSTAPLSTTAARNLYLQRQTHFNFTFDATLELPILSLEQQAGITCYYDENTYLTFHLIRTTKGLELQVIEHIDDYDRTILPNVVIDREFTTIRFLVKTIGLTRSFFYQLDSHLEQYFGTLFQVNYLCDEGLKKGKRFTGAMFGLFAYGGTESLNVKFTDFHIWNER